MKGLLGLLVTAAIGVGIYLYVLKQAAPAPGMVVTQAISTTGVQMDLLSIAQAERMYYAQNGAYTDLDTLASSGTMNIMRAGRDGYTYSADVSQGGFVITAEHTAPPPPMPAGVAPPVFPTYTIDQNMQVQQSQ